MVVFLAVAWPSSPARGSRHKRGYPPRTWFPEQKPAAEYWTIIDQRSAGDKIGNWKFQRAKKIEDAERDGIGAYRGTAQSSFWRQNGRSQFQSLPE
jgi:hypothetical protein